jgi:hypothetical protein
MELPNCARSLIAVLTGSSIAMIAAANAAQPTSAQTAAIRSNCSADYQKYCSSVPPGGQASLDCLSKNVASLSSACQSAVKAVSTPAAASATGAGEATTAAPAATSTAPAASTTPAGTPLPEGQLPPRQELQLLRNACGPDFRKLCGNIPLGGGNGMACLRSKQSQLSQHCISAIVAAHGG